MTFHSNCQNIFTTFIQKEKSNQLFDVIPHKCIDIVDMDKGTQQMMSRR